MFAWWTINKQWTIGSHQIKAVIQREHKTGRLLEFLTSNTALLLLYLASRRATSQSITFTNKRLYPKWLCFDKPLYIARLHWRFLLRFQRMILRRFQIARVNYWWFRRSDLNRQKFTCREIAAKIAAKIAANIASVNRPELYVLGLMLFHPF